MLFHIGLTLVVLLGVSVSQGADRTDVDITDERVQRYARMAIEFLNEKNRRDGLPEQELNGVKSAQQQVVSAIYYYITMTVRQVGCHDCPPQSCEATVFYQSWTHTEQVMAMECAAVQTTVQTRMLRGRSSMVKARALEAPARDNIPEEHMAPIETRDNFAKGNTPPVLDVAKFAVHQYNKHSDVLYNYSLEGVVFYTKTDKVNLGIKYNLVLRLGNPTCKLASLAQSICHRPRHEKKHCRTSVSYRSWLDPSRQYQVLGTMDCTAEQHKQI